VAGRDNHDRKSMLLAIGVWDNGPGIPPTIQNSVFQPFVIYGKADGSGLGLAIAKKIVEDHGGEIDVDVRSATETLFIWGLSAETLLASKGSSFDSRD
jgi:nitrogen-specific signal transduction histidine kinase